MSIAMWILFAIIGGLIFFGFMFTPQIVERLQGTQLIQWLESKMQQDKDTIEYSTADYSLDALYCAVEVVIAGDIQRSCLDKFNEELKYRYKRGTLKTSKEYLYTATDSQADIEKARLECAGKAKKWCDSSCEKNYKCDYYITHPIERNIAARTFGDNYYYECMPRCGLSTLAGPAGSFSSPLGQAEGLLEPFASEPVADKNEFVGGTGVKCEDKNAFSEVDYIRAGNIAEAGTKCKELFGEKATASAYGDSFACNIPQTRCTVEDFFLPQKVPGPSEWIKTYGDPKHVVYWQVFPQQWDTWSFQPTWKLHAAIIALSVLPVGKIPAYLAKASGKSIFAVIKNIVKPSKFIGFTSSNKYTTIAIAKETFKKVFSEAAYSGKYLSKPINIARKGLTLEAGTLALKLADSVISMRYDPQPNSLVYKTPYVEPESKPLLEGWKGKPVLITWDPGWMSYERLTPFHLVSPCKINNLAVHSPVNVKCKYYMFDWKTGESKCGKDDKDDWGIEVARSFNQNELCDIRFYLNPDDASLSKEKIGSLPSSEVVNELRKGYDVTLVTADFNDKGDIEIKSKGKATADVAAKDMEDTDAFISGGVNKKGLTLKDEDRDGFFDTFLAEDCITPAVVVEFNIDEKDDNYENNYCVSTVGGLEKIASGIGTAIGGAGVVVGTVVLVASGVGAATVAGATVASISLSTVAIVATATGGLAELVSLYEKKGGSWPSTSMLKTIGI